MSRLLQRANPAIIYSLLWRGFQSIATIVNLLLIARVFNLQLQGYYYTFASIAAIQTFFELGFSIVILNVSAHEWSGLSLGHDRRVAGNQENASRLASLVRLVFQWYGVAAACFSTAALVIGFHLLARGAETDVAWRAPWICVALVAGLNFWMEPFCALLEGCNQVAEISKFRIIQALVSNSLTWITILLGGGLWAYVAMGLGQAVVLASLLLVRYRPFFVGLRRVPLSHRVSWRRELWPMQWRLACSGVVNYFAFSLFTPAMFYFHGGAAAGRMGMTLQIVNGLQLIASIWMKTKWPTLGMLVARRAYAELDREWARAALASFLSFVGLGTLLAASLAVVNHHGWGFGDRVLPLLSVILFLTGGALLNFSMAMSAYLRAHKEEPILLMSVSMSVAIGLAVWWLGRTYGPLGAASAYAVCVAGGVLWQTAIWRRCRRIWHQPFSDNGGSQAAQT